MNRFRRVALGLFFLPAGGVVFLGLALGTGLLADRLFIPSGDPAAERTPRSAVLPLCGLQLAVAVGGSVLWLRLYQPLDRGLQPPDPGAP